MTRWRPELPSGTCPAVKFQVNLEASRLPSIGVVGTPHGLPIEVPLFGRDREVDRVDELVRSIELGARFVVIRGEAGIGKTSLWRVALQRHRAAGHRTLVTRPTEEELYGPAVGLADLFGGVTDRLSELQEHDRFESGQFVLDMLRALATDTPVVVAVDDVQWFGSGVGRRAAVRVPPSRR